MCARTRLERHLVADASSWVVRIRTRSLLSDVLWCFSKIIRNSRVIFKENEILQWFIDASEETNDFSKMVVRQLWAYSFLYFKQLSKFPIADIWLQTNAFEHCTKRQTSHENKINASLFCSHVDSFAPYKSSTTNYPQVSSIHPHKPHDGHKTGSGQNLYFVARFGRTFSLNHTAGHQKVHTMFAGTVYIYATDQSGGPNASTNGPGAVGLYTKPGSSPASPRTSGKSVAADAIYFRIFSYQT